MHVYDCSGLTKCDLGVSGSSSRINGPRFSRLVTEERLMSLKTKAAVGLTCMCMTAAVVRPPHLPAARVRLTGRLHVA